MHEELNVRQRQGRHEVRTSRTAQEPCSMVVFVESSVEADLHSGVVAFVIMFCQRSI
jgi:hypothetical protein